MSTGSVAAPVIGGISPWGLIEEASVVAPGITFVSTPTHGGYHVAPDRLASVDPRWGVTGAWFNEDDEWAIVAFSFPDAFSDFAPTAPADADALLRAWRPDAYEAITGRPVQDGESHARDLARFVAANPDGLWCYAAYASGFGLVPEGHVAVQAEVDALAVLARSRGDYGARSAFRWVLLTEGDYRSAMAAHGRIAPDKRCERFPGALASDGVCFNTPGGGIPYTPASALQQIRLRRHSDAEALESLGWWRPATAALLHAKQGRFAPAVELLAKCSASESEAIRDGVLWLASRAGDAQAVGALLGQGADPSWCAAIALEAAEFHGHATVIEALRPGGAPSGGMTL